MNEREMNKDELRNAPFLDSLKKEDVFQVPESYFDNFSNKLQDKIQDDEIQQIAESFGDKRKETLFETPPGYFEQLPDIIRQRILELPSAKKSGGHHAGRRRFSPLLWGSIAATIALLFALGYWMNSLSRVNSDMPLTESAVELQLEQSLQRATAEELLAAIDVEDYSLDMIIEAMDEEDLAALPGTYELELSEDEILDFLEEVEITDFDEEF